MKIARQIPVLPILWLVLAFGVATLVAGRAADATLYPGNKCVSHKQTQAGAYCNRVLKAWASWDRTRDDAQRDRRLQGAAARLSASWAAADQKAAKEGVDCADTTLSATDVASLIDTAAAAIVADINDGLDLGNRRDAACGNKLLNAAAQKCVRLLSAEGKHIETLGKDPTGRAREARQGAANRKFSSDWARATEGGCPTSASGAGIETLIDGIKHEVVSNTIVSPHVDNAQFITISPTPTVDYLGRTYTPVCMGGTNYQFFAKRGSVNKLLMYYQGGGACWEPLTCTLPACDPDVTPGDNPNNFSSGFADLNNPNNPFRDWNAVFVSYCSCDVHFGDAAQNYPPRVEHRGYHNARVVEKWAREHFVNPETVFVTGSSAGAYGAWFHAPLLHDVWPASQFHVLADAGNGVITQDFLVNFFPNWDFQRNIPDHIPGLQQVLDEGTGIVAYTDIVGDFFPRTNWAHYTAAFDGGTGGQTGFYNIMLHDNNPTFALLWWQGSCAFNQVMRQQAIDTAALVPNYRYYIGSGSRHTMWGNNKVYTDTAGGVPTIVDWVNAMLSSSPGSADPGWTNVECTNCGLTLPGDPRPTPSLECPFEMEGPDVVINCVDCGP